MPVDLLAKEPHDLLADRAPRDLLAGLEPDKSSVSKVTQFTRDKYDPATNKYVSGEVSYSGWERKVGEPWAEKFIADHPNIYGMYGIGKEFTKFGHLRYVYPEEREKLMALPKQKQTRQLLMDTLEDVGALGIGKILNGLGSIAGGVFERFTPKLYQMMTKSRSLTNNKAYMDLLREIADADLKAAGAGEPEILKLIRREPEVYMAPAGRTPEQMGVKIDTGAKAGGLVEDITKEVPPRLLPDQASMIAQGERVADVAARKEALTGPPLLKPSSVLGEKAPLPKYPEMPAKPKPDTPAPAAEGKASWEHISIIEDENIPYTAQYHPETNVIKVNPKEIDKLSKYKRYGQPADKVVIEHEKIHAYWDQGISKESKKSLLDSLKSIPKSERVDVTSESVGERAIETLTVYKMNKGLLNEREVNWAKQALSDYPDLKPAAPAPKPAAPSEPPRLPFAALTEAQQTTALEMAKKVGAKPGEAKKLDYQFDENNKLVRFGESRPKVESRSVIDILKDVNTAIGQRGSIGGKIEDLSVKQKQALARLMQDAERAGKSAEDFLREHGFDKKAVTVLANYFTQTKPIPKYAQSVNLEKQNISDSAKRLEVEMADEKKYQSWDTTNKLSDSILANPDKWKTAFRKVEGLKNLTENIEAVRKININGVDRLAKLNEEFAVGRMTEEAFQNEFKLMQDDIFKVLSDGQSEVGRAMNSFKRVLNATDQLGKGLAKIEGKMTEPQRKAFAEAVKNMENPVAIQRFLNTVTDPTLKDYILEYWYGQILSGPPTQLVNVTSNTLWALYHVPNRTHVAIIDKFYSGLTGKERTRVINEVIPMLMGFKSGYKRGGSSAWEVLRTGTLQNIETKWSQEMGMSAVGAWERSPYPWMRKIAPLISPFSRALRAMDVWAKAGGYDAEMLSIATRKGVLKGLKGDELKSFMTKFVHNPPEEAITESMKWANHITFMDDLDPFTNWVLGVREVPVAGFVSHFVIPFVRTIANLTKRGIELTPGMGIAKEFVSRKMGRGMSDPEIIAKQIEGSLLSLYVLYQCSEGRIIGAAPQDPAKRERFYAQKKIPWSMYVGGKKNPETGLLEGGTCISFRRIEPFNTVIASTAIAYDKIVNAKDDETRIQIFGNMANDFKNNLIDSSYFQGIQQVFNRHQKFEQAPQRTAASFVPYSSFWRSMNHAYEKATEGDVKLREKGSWLSAFAQVIPSLSGKVPAELNIWGNEIVKPGSILQHWLPYKWSRETQDPVEIELERLNKSLEKSTTGLQVYPGQPIQTITIRDKKIKLSDDVYRDYLIDLGRELRSTYEKTMSSESYLYRSDEQKAQILNRNESRARNKIRHKLIGKITKGD